MGGHIVVASLEQYPEVYDGALAECGSLMQIQENDYMIAVAAAADFLSGANALPAADLEAYANLVTNTYIPAFGGAEFTTFQGRQFESVVKHLGGGARPWRHEGIVDWFTRFAREERGSILQTPTSPASMARTNTEV